MFNNYLTRALRSFQKNAVFTLINVIGLCLGMTAFLLLMEFVSYEKSYNSFHENLPNLYRVLSTDKTGNVAPYTAPGFAPLADAAIPGLNQYCRLAEGSNLGTGVVSFKKNGAAEEESFRENNFIYADGNFFGFFSFPLIDGQASAMSKPNVVAISKATSEKFFGKEPAVGKLIALSNQFGKTLYTVEAVYDDMPANSDLNYTMVFSIQTLYNSANLNGNESWASMDGTGSQWLFTYVSLEEGSSRDDVASQYSQVMRKASAEDPGQCVLQPVATMHLGSSLNDPLPTFGSLKFIYLLIVISIVILFIGWFNFINLTTAGSLRRAKEVGVRKVVGASRSQLIRQFLGESLLINALALICSIAIVGVLQTPYRYLIGKPVSLESLSSGSSVGLCILLLIIGILSSGFYAAFVLSSFKASKVLKGSFARSGSGVLVRKSLVIFQFSVSIMLIISTVVLFQQWKFMEGKELGLSTEQLVVIRGAEVNKDETFKGRSKEFESAIQSFSFVESISRSGNVPSDGFNFSTSGITKLNPAPGSEEVNYDILTIDERYADTYGIQFAAGRNFTPEMCDKGWNEMEDVILNETAAEKMGFDSPDQAVDQLIKWGEKRFRIRGVLKDYHHLSVQYPIGPILFFPSVSGGYYTLKINNANMNSSIDDLEQTYRKNFPGNPFEYRFVSDSFAATYFAERQYSTIFSVASGLAILIACMGLFGLAMYSVEQRGKEIGIRKVLGSSAYQIVSLFSGDFMRLVAVGFIISIPAASYFVGQWLDSFAYHVELKWWVFAIAGIATGLIAWLTVSVQVLKGATVDPVKRLRSE